MTDRQIIEEVAAAVDGVVEIINNITVVPSESESDETIQHVPGIIDIIDNLTIDERM